MAFPVFLDTCTLLLGQVLNDLLLNLAERGCFAPYWSSEVLDALERNVATTARTDAGLIRRRRLMMELAFPTATLSGYERLVDQMTNDPRDRHVLAACVRSPANALVTYNLKDFPGHSVELYEIEVLHPDQFLLDQLDVNPVSSREAIGSMLRSIRMPPQDFASLAAALRTNALPQAAEVIGAMV